VFAAIETDVRHERQLEGIAMALRQGVCTRGKPRLDRLSNQGLRPAAIARELGMVRSSVYRLLEKAAADTQRKHVPGSNEQREFSLVNQDSSMAEATSEADRAHVFGRSRLPRWRDGRPPIEA
jgi:hypothetical protein